MALPSNKYIKIKLYYLNISSFLCGESGEYTLETIDLCQMFVALHN